MPLLSLQVSIYPVFLVFFLSFLLYTSPTPLKLPLSHLPLHLPGPPPLRCPALSLCGTACPGGGPVHLAVGRLPLLYRLQASHARAGAASLVHADVS